MFIQVVIIINNTTIVLSCKYQETIAPMVDTVLLMNDILTFLHMQNSPSFKLTLKAPITTNDVCCFRLLKCFRGLLVKQCRPRSGAVWSESKLCVSALT